MWFFFAIKDNLSHSETRDLMFILQFESFPDALEVLAELQQEFL
jgi:hypothetical protein